MCWYLAHLPTRIVGNHRLVMSRDGGWCKEDGGQEGKEASPSYSRAAAVHAVVGFIFPSTIALICLLLVR